MVLGSKGTYDSPTRLVASNFLMCLVLGFRVFSFQWGCETCETCFKSQPFMLASLNKGRIIYPTVDGRNPKQPPGMYQTLYKEWDKLPISTVSVKSMVGWWLFLVQGHS